jgi:hypothetical protein
MKKEITTSTPPKKDLKSLSDIKPLTEGQTAELKGGFYSYSYSYASCCTDKRRPIRVRYSYYY